MRNLYHRGIAGVGALWPLLAVAVALGAGATAMLGGPGAPAEYPGGSVATRSADGMYTFTFSTGGFSAEQLGSEVGGVWDRLDLLPLTDTVTLAEGVPTPALVNLGSFQVGYTGQPVQVPLTVARDLTVQGVTRRLSQPATIVTGITTDRIHLHEGETVTYVVDLPDGRGILEVTPRGDGLWGSVHHPTNSELLHATFLLRKVE